MGRSLRLVPLAVVLSLAAGGCADAVGSSVHGDGAGAASPSSAYPLTVRTAAGSVTVDARPRRIVSLSPTATEMLFAIGAGDRVVAVDDQSNYPPQAPTTDLSGYEPNAESIASYRPDLVVYANDLGDVAAALDRLGIPALLEPAASDLRDAYAQIEQLGVVTDRADAARRLIARMRSRIDDIVSSVSDPRGAPTYYHELDDTYYTVTSSTFIGRVYSLLGLRNIADAADKDGTGYPQLSAEYILDADPDIIFLADTKCCDQSAGTVARRPGWDGIAAVRNDDVVALDDDVASRWGPRIVGFLQTVADAVRRADDTAAA
jgi:iron complex transport system substrate-binding protein